MRVDARGSLGVWHGIPAPHQREGEDWYNREHHAERVAVPGFLRARRYINRGSGLRYFSRYDTVDVAVLASAHYHQALNNPSAWSQRIFPHYQNTVRGAFTVVARQGFAEGGFLTTMRFPDHSAPTDGTLRSIAEPLLACNGVVGVEVWRVDADVTGARTREKELRAAQEPYPGAVLLVEATAPEAAAEAVRHVAPELTKSSETDVYQLVFQKFAKE